MNAAAQELGTTWPSLRKAFQRHGLGMSAHNPEAVRQRAVAAASQRGSPPAAPPLNPVFAALNHQGQLPARRGPHAEQGMRLRRAEEIETLSYRTVVELNAESRLAPERRVATIAAAQNAPNASLRSGPAGPSGASSSASPASTAATDSTLRPRSGGWWPMPDRPTLPEPISDQGAARFRADLAAYLNSMFLHEPAELLGELPEPTRVALMDELSEHGPAWAKLPEDRPQLPRWSLREQLADRRSARRPPSPEQLRRWRAEALRARAISRDPAQQHQQRKEPSPGRPPRARDWPGQDRGHGRDHP